jgi:hypothetical protein
MSWENAKGADQIVELARSAYRFSRDTSDEVFAVAKKGPMIARYFLGEDQTDFKAALAHKFQATHRRTPTAGTLSDAMQVLVGDSLSSPAERCYLRVAPLERHGVAVDLGRPDGKTVIVQPSGEQPWAVVDTSPMVFRRSALTAELPLPAAGGDLNEIQKVFGLSDLHWQLVLGWMLAAYDGDMPHPILALFGPAGAGKSCLARLVVRLCDPSPAPLRSVPRTDEDWHIAASSSWIYAVDNLSEIKPWLSDALCAAATGNSRIARKKYTSKGLTVTSLKLPIILTGIEVGSLWSDLGDRLVMIELPPRPAGSIRSESQLERIIESRLPLWFGALCEAVARTQERRRQGGAPAELSRMADYCQLLKAADAAGVTTGAMTAYARNRAETADEVAMGDEVAEAVLRLMERQPQQQWAGTASELLVALNAVWVGDLPPHWPKAANHLSRRLRRLASALAVHGVRYRARREPSSRQRLIHLSLTKREQASSASSADELNPFGVPEPRPSSPNAAGTDWRSPNDPGGLAVASPTDTRTVTGRSMPHGGGTPSWATHGHGDPGDRAEKSDDALGLTQELSACQCGSKKVVDVAIHDGKSVRRDCEDCGRFRDFLAWKAS